MSKRNIIVISLGIFATFLVVLVFILGRRAEIKPSPSVNSETRENGEKIYQDASGFSFNYPDVATASDVTPEDNSYYSVLEITSPKTSGKIKITIKDTKVSSVDEWLYGGEETPKSGKLVGAASLGNLSAKQYSLSRDSENLLLTATVDQKVLYLIEGPKDSGFWEDAQNTIVYSFSLGKTTSNAVIDSATYEAEEVVE